MSSVYLITFFFQITSIRKFSPVKYLFYGKADDEKREEKGWEEMSSKRRTSIDF